MEECRERGFFQKETAQVTTRIPLSSKNCIKGRIGTSADSRSTVLSPSVFMNGKFEGCNRLDRYTPRSTRANCSGTFICIFLLRDLKRLKKKNLTFIPHQTVQPSMIPKISVSLLHKRWVQVVELFSSRQCSPMRYHHSECS